MSVRNIRGAPGHQVAGGGEAATAGRARQRCSRAFLEGDGEVAGGQLGVFGEDRGQLTGVGVGGGDARELEVDPVARVFELDQQAELAGLVAAADRQVAGMGLQQVDRAGDRFAADRGPGYRVAEGEQWRERDSAADLRGFRASNGLCGVVVDLVSGRVRALVRAGLEAVGRGRRERQTGGQLDGDVLRLGRLGDRGVIGGVLGIGRVVRLREVEVDGETRGRVGLDRAEALQRFGRDRGFIELGGEFRVVAAGDRRGQLGRGYPFGIAAVRKAAGQKAPRMLPGACGEFPRQFGPRAIRRIGEEGSCQGTRFSGFVAAAAYADDPADDFKDGAVAAKAGSDPSESG